MVTRSIRLSITGIVQFLILFKRSFWLYYRRYKLLRDRFDTFQNPELQSVHRIVDPVNVVSAFLTKRPVRLLLKAS